MDFTNAVLILTSNLGAAEAGAIKAERKVGFGQGSGSVSQERIAEVMVGAARSALPPELYNRIDEVLCFGPLAKAEVAEIARRLLDGLGDALGQRGVRLDYGADVVEALLEAGDVTKAESP